MRSCVPGCMAFSSNETKHYKDCPHYSASMSRLLDETTKELNDLKKHQLVGAKLFSVQNENITLRSALREIADNSDHDSHAWVISTGVLGE